MAVIGKGHRFDLICADTLVDRIGVVKMVGIGDLELLAARWCNVSIVGEGRGSKERNDVCTNELLGAV